MSRRRFFAPEVIQTSAMDCGPAALKCLLEGHHIPVSLGRLREACQTDVDGTSLDTLEDVAQKLGLEAEQILLPVDALRFVDESAFPCLVVTTLPMGITHFEVLWRRVGSMVQVMDPAQGRSWISLKALERRLYAHVVPMSSETWREFAASPTGIRLLTARMRHLGLNAASESALVEAAVQDPSFTSLAALEASLRLTTSLKAAGVVRNGKEASQLVRSSFLNAQQNPQTRFSSLPEAFWSVWPATPALEDGKPLMVRGAVMVRIKGVADKASSITPDLSPELRAALTEKPARPSQTFSQLLRMSGVVTPPAIVLGSLAAAVAVLLEALLYRGLLEILRDLGLPIQRFTALGVGLFLMAVMIGVELALADITLRLGRQLEIRLREAFLRKLPRLADPYFRSRPSSDLADRAHHLHLLRQLPAFVLRFIETSFELIFTVLAIALLDPAVAWLALTNGATTLLIPLLAQPFLAERDLRARTHGGALAKFHLEALLASLPIRTHGAERALRREQESLLVEWARASFRMLAAVVSLETLQISLSTLLSAAILFMAFKRSSGDADLLLLAFFALKLPTLSGQLSLLSKQYPGLRNITLRLLDPLGAPEVVPPGPPPLRAAASGVSIEMQQVSVTISGRTILKDVTTRIPSGAHVAIVGPSGAGKSTLMALFLGWHRTAAGLFTVDGSPLDDGNLEALRPETAWVDPAISLWNRSLLENLTYGMDPRAPLPDLGSLLSTADLLDVLDRIPDGLRSRLGEAGGLLSGGEGQRVRLGRALNRPGARLVLLDEPFRGLDRSRRTLLLQRARAFWPRATLLCITHDIQETRAFDRILVLEQGRLVEEGTPDELLARPKSRYRALLVAEAHIHQTVWRDPSWRRLTLKNGLLVEEPTERRKT